MKAARNIYDHFAVMTEAERAKCLAGLSGAGLDALLHYAEGREATTIRDQVIGIVLVTAAERYLARVQAKANKKAKRILG